MYIYIYIYLHMLHMHMTFTFDPAKKIPRILDALDRNGSV